MKRCILPLALLALVAFSSVAVAAGITKSDARKAAKAFGATLVETSAAEGLELYDVSVAQCKRQSAKKASCLLSFTVAELEDEETEEDEETTEEDVTGESEDFEDVFSDYDADLAEGEDHELECDLRIGVRLKRGDPVVSAGEPTCD